MLKFTDFYDGKIEEPVEVDPHSGEPIESIDERVLSVQDRMKLSRRMKRFQHRIQRKRKIQMRRKADAGRLQKRARKGARSDMKKRVSGGKSYRKMTFGMKKMVDQKLENKARQSAIKRFTKRKVKDKRKLDIARRKWN